MKRVLYEIDRCKDCPHIEYKKAKHLKNTKHKNFNMAHCSLTGNCLGSMAKIEIDKDCPL